MLIGSLLLASSLSAPPSSPDPSGIVLDGVSLSRMKEAEYIFRCRENRVRIGYRQERLHPKEVPKLIDALRVALTDFSISDRRIESREFQRAKEAIRIFGWIDRIDVQCGSNYVLIDVHGMPLQPWIDYIEKDLDERPALATRTIRVSKSGIIAILD